MRQDKIIRGDKHPYYKEEHFQSKNSYKIFKERLLCNIANLLENLDHVHVDFVDSSELLEKYSKKLRQFPFYYDKLVEKIFKYELFF